MTVGLTLEDSNAKLWRAGSLAVNGVVGKLLDEKRQSGPAFNRGLMARRWSVFAVNTRKEGDCFKCAWSSENLWTHDRPNREPEHVKGWMQASNNLKAIQRAFEQPPQAMKDALQRQHERQQKLLADWEKRDWRCYRIEMSQTSPLVHGLGESHPLERFLTFDHTSGVPYLPATSVKGVLKMRVMACVLNEIKDLEQAEQDKLLIRTKNEKRELMVNPDHPCFRKLFGSTDEFRELQHGQTTRHDPLRGQVIFLDAFPLTVPKLKLEIMTTHYPDYYVEGSGHRSGPTESQNPVPNAYLSVDPQNGAQDWAFSFLCAPELPEADKSLLLSVFASDAGLDIGFGSKTAIGFGRFRSLAEDSIQKQQAELQREAAEETRRQAEEAAKLAGERILPEVERLANWGELRLFAEQKLATLDQQEYIPELGMMLREKAQAMGVPSNKLKKNPNLLLERLTQVEEWLSRFEKG